MHQLLRRVWKHAAAWAMGRYVVMPDHIHCFAASTESPITFDAWVKYWKSQFSKQHGNPSHRWLADHWDTRMRSETQYEDKWNYVRYNPVRHRLVTDPDDWPYQGEIHRLDWR